MDKTMYAQNMRLLKERNIEFESFNEGLHLRIGRFDFWPSTGTFVHRDTGKKGIGIARFIAIVHLQEIPDRFERAVHAVGRAIRDPRIPQKEKETVKAVKYSTANKNIATPKSISTKNIKRAVDRTWEAIRDPRIPQTEKHPLGIKPQFVYLLERRIEIMLALKRYAKAKKAIPLKWIEELDEIINKEGRK